MTRHNHTPSRISSLNPFRRRTRKSAAERFAGAHETHDIAAMVSVPFETAAFHQLPVWRSL